MPWVCRKPISYEILWEISPSSTLYIILVSIPIFEMIQTFDLDFVDFLIQCIKIDLKRVAQVLFGRMGLLHLNIAMEKQCFGKMEDMIGGTIVVVGMAENA